MEITLRESKNISKVLFSKKKPAIVMGTPGIGKTDILKQVAAELNVGFLCFEASSLDPTDVRGVLIPKGEASVYTRSALLPVPEKHGKGGMLLIDELPSGLPAVQVALHPLFHPKERRLGSDSLPEGWVPMATGNYASDGAGAYNLLTALTDRVCVLNVKEDLGIWKEDFALPHKIHPIVLGFLNFRPDLFSTFEKRVKGGNGKSFASPRTWKEASDLLYTDLDGVALHGSLSGYLGDGVSSEVMAFRKTVSDLPDVDAIYAGRINTVPEEPSVLYALCGAMVGKLMCHPDGLRLSVAIERFLEYSLKLPAEFAVLMVKDALSLHRKEIVQGKGWKAFANKYRDVLLDV